MDKIKDLKIKKERANKKVRQHAAQQQYVRFIEQWAKNHYIIDE